MAKINNSGHKKATFKKMDQRKPTWKYFIWKENDGKKIANVNCIEKKSLGREIMLKDMDKKESWYCSRN